MLNLQLIDTFDTTLISWADISDYGNKVIKNPSFEVTAPGFNKVNVFFTPKQWNSFDAADLEIGCGGQDLPDGVYTVKYSIFPNTNNFIEKQFYRITKLKLKYQDYLLSLMSDSICNCTPLESENRLGRLRLLIEGVVAAANICQIDKANMFYKKADDLINQYKCDCNG